MANPALLSQMESNQEEAQGSPLGDTLTKGVGILGDFVHSNPALLLGLGASLLRGEGIGVALSQGAKAQTVANQSDYDRQAAAQTKALEDAKFALETKRVNSAAEVAQQNLEVARENAVSSRITAEKSGGPKATTAATKNDIAYAETFLKGSDVYKNMDADNKEKYINFVASGMRHIMAQNPGTSQKDAVKQSNEKVIASDVLSKPGLLYGVNTSIGQKPDDSGIRTFNIETGSLN